MIGLELTALGLCIISQLIRSQGSLQKAFSVGEVEHAADTVLVTPFVHDLANMLVCVRLVVSRIVSRTVENV